MTLDFTCQSCDATFEADLSDLLEEPVVECPSCEARAPRAAVEGVLAALDDLFSQLAQLRRKFTVVLEVESDDLPASYDREARRTASSSDEGEDDDAEEDDEGSWDEEAAERDEDEEER